MLEQRFPSQAGDTATVVFAVDEGTLREGGHPAAIARTVRAIQAQPHVTAAVDPLSREGRGQLSRDGRIAFTTVQYDQRGERARPRRRRAARGGLRSAAAGAGLEVSRGGAIVDQAEQQIAPVGELIGVAVAVIVLTLVFRSAAAMAVTLVSALIALAGGILLLRFGAAFTDFPSFAPTLGVMLGLGAGIDYALLIVGRYREQLAAGDSVPARRERRRTPRRARRWSRRVRSSSSRSPACLPPASRSWAGWASARRSSWPRSRSAR